MMKLGNKLKNKDIKKLQEQMPKLEKAYHCVCDECGFGWYSNEDYNIQKHCPKCLSGNVYVYGEEDDNF